VPDIRLEMTDWIIASLYPREMSASLLHRHGEFLARCIQAVTTQLSRHDSKDALKINGNPGTNGMYAVLERR
jgi:hypothetical protein